MTTKDLLTALAVLISSALGYAGGEYEDEPEAVFVTADVQQDEGE